MNPRTLRARAAKRYGGVVPPSSDLVVDPPMFWRGGVLWVSISTTHARPAEPDEYDEWFVQHEGLLFPLDHYCPPSAPRVADGQAHR